MTVMTLHIANKNDMQLVEHLVKSLKIPFEKKKDEKSPYNPEFVAKIKRGEKEFKDGKGEVIAIDDLWK